MFQRIKNLASSVAQTIRPTSREGTPNASQADDIAQDEAKENLIETQQTETTASSVEVVDAVLPSEPLPPILSEKELEETETDKEGSMGEDDDDQNPDSVYFQRNYLFNIAALPLDNFETTGQSNPHSTLHYSQPNNHDLIVSGC